MLKCHILSCPICDKLLKLDDMAGGQIIKSCKTKNHTFEMLYHSEWDEIISVSFQSKKSKNNTFLWFFIKKELSVTNDITLAYHVLPWIEPDFYNYEPLIKKLNIYVLFS